MMRKTGLILMSIFFLMFAAACGGQSANGNDGGNEMVTYESETGPIQVPANPRRIVGLAYAPNVLALGSNLVGVDEWTNMNPLFTEKLAGVEVVSDQSVEKILELEPDLIIAADYSANLDKLRAIAPTVTYSWGKLDYLSQQIEIGKLLGKEKEAREWVEDFKKRAVEAGAKIREKYGEDVTISVLESDAKQVYVFGDRWARGTDLLYQTMGLKMPKKVEEDALGPGYHALSFEVVADYVGDWIVLSKNPDGNYDFLNTDTWKNLPAVQNNRVIEIDTRASTYNDPITLETLFEIYTKAMLGE